MSEEAAVVPPEEPSKKEEILQKLKEILEKISEEDLQNVTAKSIREELATTFGEEVSKFKAEIKEALSERFLKVQVVENTIKKEEKAGGEEEEGNDEGSESDLSEGEEEEEEEDDEEHPDVALLPEEWKAEFGSVVWVKTSPKYPWWPAIIYNPTYMSRKLRDSHLKFLGKKHAVYNYGSNDWDNALPKQIKPFMDNYEEFKTQKVPKKYQAVFDKGMALAKDDAALPSEDRASWNHKARKRPAKKAKPMPKPTPKTKTVKKEKKKAVTKKSATKKEKATPKVEKKVEKNVENPQNTEDLKEEKITSDEESEKEFEEDEFKLESEGEDEDGDAEEDAYVEEKVVKKKKKKKTSSEEDADSSKKKRPRTNEKKEKPEKRAKKSSDESAVPKKKKRKSSEDDEKIKEKKDKDNSKSKVQSEASKSQPLSASQKRKLLEEKNMMEKNRIDAMKSSSEPVWKQARAQSTKNDVAEKSSSTILKASSNVAKAVRPEETPLERARRLTLLIENRIKQEEQKEPDQFQTAPIIKIMRKARDIDLSLSDWASSKFIDLVNTLRKYPYSKEIANEAKEIRTFLKNKMSAMATTQAPAPPLPPSSVTDKQEVPPPPVVNDDSLLHGNVKKKKSGRHHALAVDLIISRRNLSSDKAKTLVTLIEKIHDPARDKEVLSRFLSLVHQFCFGESSYDAKALELLRKHVESDEEKQLLSEFMENSSK